MSNKQTEVEDAAKSVWGRVYMFQSCDDKRAILRIEQAITKAKEEERERCTDIIADLCSFVMENSKSEEIRRFASSLANRLYSVITSPKEDHLPDRPINSERD